MKLRTQILAGYLAVFLIMLVTGLTMYARTRRLVETADLVHHTHHVVADTEQALRLALSMETGHEPVNRKEIRQWNTCSWGGPAYESPGSVSGR